VAAGEQVLQPLLDEFMDKFPEVSARLQMLDRPVSLIDEGIDVALRLAHLPDSTLVALRVGEVRRVVAASPRYLARHEAIRQPADLAGHQIIAMTHFGIDSWSFPPPEGSTVPRTLQFTPRFVVNSIRAAVASAVQGRGVVRMFSYHLANEVGDGALKIILADHEHEPLPVHLVAPQGRLSVPKVRAFVDFARPRLIEYFEQRALVCQASGKDPRS
jgi:DNA-binding transcriptional LysR family regulator